MKFLIIAVNYNSYKELKTYLNSIDQAAKNTKCKVEVVIADNSTKKELIEKECYKNINIKIYLFDNFGYLGAAQKVIDLLDVYSYDYIAISNVDLTMNVGFIKKLISLNFDSSIAWIAPQIYSHDENRDRNPKVLYRYTKFRLTLLYYMYKYSILFYLYSMTIYRRKKLLPKYTEMNIYAGHGSFILLTRSFFESYNKIEYPLFLFGEEIFLAELIRNVNKKVRYVPSLIIEDTEHVSTSTLKKKSYFKYNKESIKYILDTFYNE